MNNGENRFKEISDEIAQLTSRLNILQEQGKADKSREKRLEDVLEGMEELENCTTEYNDMAVRKMI